MKYSFKIGNREMSIVCLDSAVAVRPRIHKPKAGLSRHKLASQFGKLASDDSKETPGTVVSSDSRRQYERNGWLFCEPTRTARNAAKRRIRLENAELAREVFIDEFGAANSRC